MISTFYQVTGQNDLWLIGAAVVISIASLLPIPVIEQLWALPEDKREPSSWKLERLAGRAGVAIAAAREA
jgi:hypothetical protein